jgi:hypothetical protein
MINAQLVVHNGTVAIVTDEMTIYPSLGAEKFLAEDPPLG